MCVRAKQQERAHIKVHCLRKCVCVCVCACCFERKERRELVRLYMCVCIPLGCCCCSFEVAHPAVWVGCVPLDMAGYPDLQTFGLTGHQREEGREGRREGETGGGWKHDGTEREIERKLGGNWDGHRPVRTRKESSREVCVWERERERERERKHLHICIMLRSKKMKANIKDERQQCW